MMQAFWNLKPTKNPCDDIIFAAIDKINSQLLGSRHLQGMSDTSSDLYAATKELGLPDGIIRSLRSELHDFKGIWRASQGLN